MECSYIELVNYVLRANGITFECPFECGEQVANEQRFEHYYTCMKAPVQCFKCSMSFIQENKEWHDKQLCPLGIAECRCGAEMMRKDLKNHDCFNYLKDKVRILEISNSELKEQNELLKE